MRVIGTAGHVDHGKSTLIQALTGTHPDRLKEEQEREMTIDLGFAWWNLPGGEEIGVIDVPGHRDFIENMLSGIGGIDAVLFVVAADEGVMPQTKEHLAILDILQIPGGVVALTKTDMVSDPEWLDLVEVELRQTLAGTVLEEAEILRVSAKTGEGLEELQRALEETLADHPRRPDFGRPRLPIDRLFSIPGFGTVVTGTLLDGSFQVGDQVQILPAGVSGRVRGLQTHMRQEEQAQPGTRTAINISGVSLEEITRGMVVCKPDSIQATRRLDLHFRLLPDVEHPLRHNSMVKLFVGASEVLARLRLIGKEILEPGEEAWLQLEPQDPIVALRGDRYILRRPSPGETLGGGVVLDPKPAGRHKRFSKDVLERLQALTEGTPSEIFEQAALILKAASFQELLKQSHLELEQALPAAKQLTDQGDLILLKGSSEQLEQAALIAHRGYWDQLESQLTEKLTHYHQENPLRLGFPKEEIKSKMSVRGEVFNVLLKRMEQEGKLEQQGPMVNAPGHAIKFDAAQQKSVDRLLKKFSDTPFSPPTIKTCVEEVGEEVYQALVDTGVFMPISTEVVFRQENYEKAVADVRSYIKKHGGISLGQARDHWGTTRRYAQALLEFMDSQGVTKRDGDLRKLRG